MLTLSNVARTYPTGTTALTNINLRIEAGDFLVLLGPSGCGKSTLLRLIAGLDTPQSGTLTWDEAPPAAGEIGFVFQDPTLMPWATAAENAALPFRLRGVHPGPAHAMLAQLGLADFAAARPAKLSGGMRMRVSIARALAPRPRLLLMDEPFAALDDMTRHRLQADLRGLAKSTGCTTVFVTHSIYEAAYLATRVVIMSPHPGRIAATHHFATEATDRFDPEFAARAAMLSQATVSLPC